MDYHDLYLPVETLEHIINLIPDSADGHERWRSEHRYTLLTCALVCKTWMSIARRRLLSLYFPTRTVKIRRDPQDVLALVDVFQSPFHTLDPVFIKTLHFAGYLPLKPSSGDELWKAKPQSFRGTLSTLDAVMFPSLQTFEFNNGSQPPPNGGGEDDALETPPLPVLSQIKALVFLVFHCQSFNDVVHIIRLCPFVEEVTAFVDDNSYRVMDPSLHQVHPPASPRKLVLDMRALLEVADWMMCQPNHFNISSLVIHGFSWNGYINSNYLRRFLDGVGPSLENLVLDVPESARGTDVMIYPPDAPLTQFTKNTSLKWFTLRTTQDVAVGILPYLLKQTHFSPELQTLKIVVPCWEPNTTWHGAKLRLLDQYVRSRPFLRHIIISCEWGKWPEGWGEVEHFTRQCLPYCEEKGLLEFKLRS